VSRVGREGTLKMPAEASCSAAALAPKVRGERRESGRKDRRETKVLRETKAILVHRETKAMTAPKEIKATVFRGPKAIRGTLFRDHRGKTEPMVHRGMMVLMARKGTKVVKAPKVIKERASRGHRAIKVHLFKDRRATTAKMVPRVIRANPQPFLAHKETKARQVPSPAHRVIRGAMARKEIKGMMGRRGIREKRYRAPRETKGSPFRGRREIKARKVRVVHKGIKAHRVLRGTREMTVRKVIKARRGHRGIRATLVALAASLQSGISIPPLPI